MTMASLNMFDCSLTEYAIPTFCATYNCNSCFVVVCESTGRYWYNKCYFMLENHKGKTEHRESPGNFHDINSKLHKSQKG